MNARVYVVLVALAFCGIILNALYGHLLYGSPYGQTLTKYTSYVHLQPGWESAPANILFDVTISWDGYSREGDDYNSNRIEYQQGREVVVLQHGFSDCSHSWSPPLYRYGADMLRSHILYMQGLQLDTEPYVPRVPDIHNESYPDSVQTELVRNGYAHFIPVCSDVYPASFQYAIWVNDPDLAFDAYFVPSSQSVYDYLQGGPFSVYSGELCGVANHVSYTGTCRDMGPGSGLLIILPDRLDMSLTRVSVAVLQVTSSPGA